MPEQKQSLLRKPEGQQQLQPVSKAQEDLLAVLAEPKHAGLPIEELIKLADISRATYYNAFRDQNFIATLESRMSEYRHANDFAVMHNLVEQAKTTKNHHMIAMFERLQGRLKEGGEKPAQIVLIFGEGLKRPTIAVNHEKIIEGEKVE